MRALRYGDLFDGYMHYAPLQRSMVHPPHEAAASNKIRRIMLQVHFLGGGISSLDDLDIADKYSLSHLHNLRTMTFLPCSMRGRSLL